MDTFLFAGRIKELNNELKKIRKKRLFWIIISIALNLVLVPLIVYFGINGFQVLLIISVFVLSFGQLVPFKLFIKTILATDFKKKSSQLLCSILQNEGYTISSDKTKKEYILSLKESFMITSYDYVSLNDSYDFNFNSIEGIISRVTCSRSAGKSSYTTLSGLYCILNIPTSYEFCIKTNNYYMGKVYSHKKYENNGFTQNLYLFTPKNSFNTIPDNLNKIIDEFQKINIDLYPSRFGISCDKNQICFYIDIKKMTKSLPKYLDEKVINEYLLKFTNLLSIIEENVTMLEGTLKHA